VRPRGVKPYRQRGAISDAPQRLDPFRVSAAGLPRFEADMLALGTRVPEEGRPNRSTASSASDRLGMTFLPSILLAPAQVLSTGCVTYGAVSARIGAPRSSEQAPVLSLSQNRNVGRNHCLCGQLGGGFKPLGRDRELSVHRSAARGQHECGTARPRSTEARACEARGRGHARASAASTIKNSACALSRRKQGFESPRERQEINGLRIFSPERNL
jgi:hypothetical protein